VRAIASNFVTLTLRRLLLLCEPINAEVSSISAFICDAVMTIGMSGVGACADPLPVRGAADGWKTRHSKKKNDVC
jgi:hypothetical protein